MADISFTQAAIGGLFALLGAFAGAALTRRSEYEKWHRQEKSNAFGEFLRQLHDTRTNASDAYYSGESAELAKSIKATEAFAKLEKYSGIARLHMSASGRERAWPSLRSGSGSTARSKAGRRTVLARSRRSWQKSKLCWKRSLQRFLEHCHGRSERLHSAG